MKTFKTISTAIILLAILASCTNSTKQQNKTLTTDEIKELTEEAYIYALPILMSYKTMYMYSIDEKSSQFKAPFNQIMNIHRVYGPEDVTVVSANSDTPYSLLWTDLRAEPIVLTVPEIEKERYYVAQTQDLSSNLLPYVGSRTTGNEGGTFMITGPDWKGEKPDGVDKLIPSTSQFTFTVYRTQLFYPKDLSNVEKIQEGYKVQTLSQYLGKKAPPAAIKIEFPDWKNQKEPGDDFISYLNFCLQYINPDSAEKALLEKLAPLGVKAGKEFHFNSLSPDQQEAISEGVKVAKQKIIASSEKYLNIMAGQTKKNYNSDWLWRAYVSKMGWGANDPTEASYPIIETDDSGAKLDASKNNYSITFEKGKLPPVNAFWSLTMYDGEQLMIENPLNRYLLNSTMLSDMKLNNDGSLTLYLQNKAPKNDVKNNWLPAPDGEFYMLLRVYWPKEEFLNGSWKLPGLVTETR